MRHAFLENLTQAVSLGFFLLLTVGPVLAETPETSYRVGIVPQYDARHIHRIWRPILSALEARTGLKFKLEGSPDIPRFEQQFLAGDFDFAYMNPLHMIKTQDSQRYIPLVRDTGHALQGIIVVAKDSPIEEVHQLEGKELAFPAPNSFASSLLPRAELQQRFGLHIHPVYVQNHSSVYLNVAMGRFIAGGGVLETLEQQPQTVQDRLRIIYYTRETASHPFTAHSRVPADVRHKVQQALLELSTSKAGRSLFAAIPITTLGPASMADYADVEKMNFDTEDIRD